MLTYVVANLRVTDPQKFQTYVQPALKSITDYGGRVLAAGGGDKLEVLDGGPPPERTVIIEFADVDAARRWYRSGEYQAIVDLRLTSSEGCAFLLEGLQ